MQLPEVSNVSALKDIDLEAVLRMAGSGAIGKLVEAESANQATMSKSLLIRENQYVSVSIYTKDIKLMIPVLNALCFNHAVSLIASKSTVCRPFRLHQGSLTGFLMALRGPPRMGKFSGGSLYRWR